MVFPGPIVCADLFMKLSRQDVCYIVSPAVEPGMLVLTLTSVSH